MKPLHRGTRTVAWLLIVGITTAAARAETYGVETRTNVMVPMRDGVRLATDIYLPAPVGKARGAKWPTILMRTPYNKENDKNDGRYFASHGYSVVFQDTRGRYHSDGVWHMLTDDGRDGVDTCAWIARLGGTQHAIALEHAPQFKTAIPIDAMSNLGYASMRNGGAFELRFWNWIFSNTAPSGSRASRNPATAAMLQQMKLNRHFYLLNLPLRRGTTPLAHAPEYEDWLVSGMSHGANDEFWKQNNIIDHTDQYQDIPLYLVGGWYDSWGGNTAANFVALHDKIKGPVYLIMGPWIHDGQGAFSHGQVTFGRDAAIPDVLAWQLDWFDHWLKGLDNSVGKRAPFKTPVRIFVMGSGDGHKTPDGRLNHGGFWREEHEWPLSRAKATPFYLQPRGKLSREVPPTDGGATKFQFDPARPVPTIGGNISSGGGILLQGAWDQRGGPHIWNGLEPIPLSARNDILVFQTKALDNDIEVTGPLEVKLWISSSAVDTDFTAKLLDIYPASNDFPGGFDLNIGDGILRTRFRESLKSEQMMTPEKIYPLTIRLYPTSNIFKRGHRIRVDISSSNFPRFDVNPNTGEPLNDNRQTKIAINTVHHDASHPSQIILPIVPGN
jgi:putative CocE/NonD family hydrolase